MFWPKTIRNLFWLYESVLFLEISWIIYYWITKLGIQIEVIFTNLLHNFHLLEFVHWHKLVRSYYAIKPDHTNCKENSPSVCFLRQSLDRIMREQVPSLQKNKFDSEKLFHSAKLIKKVPRIINSLQRMTGEAEENLLGKIQKHLWIRKIENLKKKGIIQVFN